MMFYEDNTARIWSDRFKPILYLFLAWMIITVAYGLMFSEEYDTDSITVTFRCTSVLADSAHYPRYVIDECIKLRMTRK